MCRLTLLLKLILSGLAAVIAFFFWYQAPALADTPHCGTLSGDETWAVADNVHIVTCDVTIPAGVTLTIEDGTIVKLGGGGEILVKGKLVAQGTISDPIYFTSINDDYGGDTNGDGTATTPTVGNWGRIVFFPESDDTSIITRAVIRYSGKTYLSISDGAIYLSNASPQLSYITFTDNYINGVELASGNWTTDVWDNSTIVYAIDEGNIAVPAANTLTINPAMKIKLFGRSIIVNGKLVASGTITNPIYFSSSLDDTLCGVGAFDEDICDTHNDASSAGSVGNWGHIVFNSGSDDTSIITRAVIRYSGKTYLSISDGAIYLSNASPQLSYITFTDNYINGVELASGNWTTDVWDNSTIVYAIDEGNIAVPAANTLTINPAMKIKLFGRSIIVNGKLVASGTITNPIYFSSSLDDTLCGVGAFDEDICDTHNDASSAGSVGNWGHIVFNSGSDDTSIITRAVIRYSGKTYLSISDGAIYLSNASPQLSYITFTDNYINGVELDNVAWETDTWDNPTVVYVLEEGDITVPAANTLTINPGMKIKLSTYDSININGKLVAVGTSEEPSYFSSWADDTVCGSGAFGEPICDTHNDGATAGATGHWGNLNFASGSDDTSIINRAVIRYAGNDGGGLNDGAIRLNGVSPSISYSSVVNNYHGIEALNGAAPTFVCNDIYNNTSYGIYNNTPATNLIAENHWWGDASGPTHAGNPGGTGQSVSDGVDYTPWKTTSCLEAGIDATKLVNVGLARPGDVLTYTIVVAETNDNQASNVFVSDSVPANTSYIPGSATVAPSGSGTLTPTASMIGWSGPVAASSSVTFTFQVTIASNLTLDTTIANTATVSFAPQPDLTPTATTTIDAGPPSSTLTLPADGAVLSGTHYLVMGTAADGASRIDQVDVNLGDGLGWQAALGTTSWMYDWTLPVDGVYTLTSRATDNVGHIETPGAGVLVTIDNTPPTSSIVSPVDGQTITATTYLITGSAEDNLSGVETVYVSPNNGSSWSTASGTTGWSYIWDVPALDNVTRVLKARAQDYAGHLEDTSIATVKVDNVAPISMITNPPGQLLAGETYIIQGTATDGSGIAKVEISTDGGTIWNTTTGTTTWVYTWTTPTTGGAYLLYTRATDGAQNVEFLRPPVQTNVSYRVYLPALLKED